METPPKKIPWALVFIVVVVLIAVAYYFLYSDGKDTNVTIPIIDGDAIDEIPNLAARYVRDTYDEETRTWRDTKGANAMKVSGALSVPKGANFVTGTTLTRCTLPQALINDPYTLFTVSKYNGMHKKRIFASKSDDWYSGHNEGMSGVAKHDDVLTEKVDRYGDDWVVSCDQRNMYRANGTRLSGLHYTQGSPTDMGVNISIGRESEFALGEIIVFSRELSESEIQIIEKVLMDKYVVRQNKEFTSMFTNDFVDDIYEAQVDCGPRSAMKTLSVSKHPELDKHRYEYKCMMEVDSSQNDEMRKIFEEREIENLFKDREPTFLENVAYQTIDCDLHGIRGFRTETNANDKTRFVFKCSSGNVDATTCDTKNSEYRPVSDVTMHDVDCGEDDEVVTTIQFKKNNEDPTQGRYEYKCCKLNA